ncbi:MAG: hypothetical protein JJ896_03810 [Rhodothermales bacterium]|nr:hypothetical protein [Rhodothermales bacterium]MBO6778761.1 hypothetical protein [Rhodothermales bacterium]
MPYILAPAMLLAGSALAQIPPPPAACPTGTAVGWLEGRDVRAPVFNTGSLFWRDQGSPNTYTDGAGRNQILAASLWVAAQFEGFLYMAGSMLGPHEFWPGPLDEFGLPPADCSPYDRVWEIRRSDIQEFERTGVVTERLRDWPVWAGAPVTDGDGDPHNYDVAAGDRPALLGDQMLWWVMNDRAGDHVASQATPLQVQVEGSAFSFDREGALGRTTFYRFRIKRSGLLPFNQAHVGLFVYGGLGDVFDDYAGSDTTANMGYFYNADNDDAVFGESPPAVGIGILRGSGPDGAADGGDTRSLDARRMTSMFTFGSECMRTSVIAGCDATYPHGRGVGYYNMMRGRWPWGEPVTLGHSRHPSQPTPLMYPGSPPEYWSEANWDGNGSALPPGDRKIVVATGPFTIVPDQESEVVFAIVTARGRDNFDSVRALRDDMSFVQSRAAVILTPLGPGEDRSVPETFPLAASGIFPNPVTTEAFVTLSLPEALPVTLDVVDMLGRRVAVPVFRTFEAGEHRLRVDASELTNGVWAWQLRAGRFSTSGTFVVAR